MNYGTLTIKFDAEAKALGYSGFQEALDNGYKPNFKTGHLVRNLKKPKVDSYAELVCGDSEWNNDSQQWEIDKRSHAEVMAETIAMNLDEDNVRLTNGEFENLIECLEEFMDYVETEVDEMCKGSQDYRESVEQDIKEMV